MAEDTASENQTEESRAQARAQAEAPAPAPATPAPALRAGEAGQTLRLLRRILQLSHERPAGGRAALPARADGHYIDARSFTRLFRTHRRNRAEICRGIYEIARRFVQRYRSMPEAWRDDAAAEAALLGIRKIEHYARRCEQGNAFSYFTKLIQMKLWEQFRVEKRREGGLAPWGREKKSAR